MPTVALPGAENVRFTVTGPPARIEPKEDGEALTYGTNAGAIEAETLERSSVLTNETEAVLLLP